jgi:hypothetical protein
LIGWVARSTWADNIPRQPLILTAPAIEKVKGIPIPEPPVYEILELAQANPPVQPAITEVLVPGNTQLGIEDPKPAGSQDFTATKPHSLPPVGFNSAPNPPAEVVVNPSTPPESEDPEKAVQSFVEQSQKVAETQLKNLRNEQAKLRARLQKIEAGVKRWEALVEALKMSTNVNSVTQSRIGPPPAPDTPDVLDAIPGARTQPTHQ